MPFGTFLEMFPPALFIAAHIAFIVVGLWAISRVRSNQPGLVGPLWLYVVSQPVFIAFLLGVITVKMAVLTEQTLIVVMVGWLAISAGRDSTTR